jgi:hypothetical protein
MNAPYDPISTRAGVRAGGAGRGRAAVSQARVVLLAMINVAQLWILSATVEAGLAGHTQMLLPLVVASGVCFMISLSILLWWRPSSRRFTSTGYIRQR